jgi:hypothetical protein
MQECAWCTLALQANINKFKTRQEALKKKLSELEQLAALDQQLMKMEIEIKAKEAELEELRKQAWGRRNAMMRSVGNGTVPDSPK